LAIYYETQRYQESAELLEKMIIRFPDNKKYWNQLSGIYFTLKRDKQALSISQLAYSHGLLKSEKELLRLAKLYLYMQLPLQAASLLEKHLADTTIDGNKKNLLLLSESLLQARELESATSYLHKAAKLSNDPELFLKLANIQASLENWPEVINVLEPVDISSLKNAGKAYLLKGIAYYEQNNNNEAIKAFKNASLDKKTQNNAQQWLQLVSH